MVSGIAATRRGDFDAKERAKNTPEQHTRSYTRSDSPI